MKSNDTMTVEDALKNIGRRLLVKNKKPTVGIAFNLIGKIEDVEYKSFTTNYGRWYFKLCLEKVIEPKYFYNAGQKLYVDINSPAYKFYNEMNYDLE